MRYISPLSKVEEVNNDDKKLYIGATELNSKNRWLTIATVLPTENMRTVLFKQIWRIKEKTVKSPVKKRDIVEKV